MNEEAESIVLASLPKSIQSIDNVASISFKETDLSIIQEAIKKKKLYLDESKNNQTT